MIATMAMVARTEAMTSSRWKWCRLSTMITAAGTGRQFRRKSKKCSNSGLDDALSSEGKIVGETQLVFFCN
jgi:hypothetical protein